MSVFNQKQLGRFDTTAANAAVSPHNFAVPAVLPEPGSSAPASFRRRRTITDGEIALVHLCVDFICACIALPLSLYILSQISTVFVNSLLLFQYNLSVDCLFPVCAIAALAL